MALALLALPASADVTFLALGDPQMGFRCSDDKQPWVRYENLSRAECIAVQRSNLHDMLQFAEDIGADFVWTMGDHVNSMANDDERDAIRLEFAEHPNLPVHKVMGNHDIVTNSCNRWGQYLLDAHKAGTATRLPIWETWEIDGHYFMGLSAMLWSFDLNACLHRAEATPITYCINERNATGAACRSGGASDNFGGATCGAAEVCAHPEGYAIDQMAALNELVARVVEDPGAKSIAFASHVLPWRVADAQSGEQGPWSGFHNARQCNDGNLGKPYDLCDDVRTGSNNCATIEWGNPGTCATQTFVHSSVDPAFEDYDWRNQVEAALAGLPAGMTTYWFAGHTHNNRSSAEEAGLRGTTVDDRVEYDFYITLGTAGPAQNQSPEEGGAAINFLSARFVHLDDDGNVTQRLIPVSEQTAPKRFGLHHYNALGFPPWGGP